jgi:hypothetical protein
MAFVGISLGDGVTNQSTTPVKVAGGLRLRSVSQAIYVACGVTLDDRAYCWGFGGLTGDGTEMDRQTPVPVANP